jgi:hypothetical protein
MESPGSVTSLVAAKLPSGDDRIDALSVRIAGNFMPPVDPNSPLTPDQAEKAKRWLAGYLNGNDALFEKDVLAETISKDEYQALIATRNLLIRLFGRLNRAFGEDPEIPATIENERERFALALWSIAFFSVRAASTCRLRIGSSSLGLQYLISTTEVGRSFFGQPKSTVIHHWNHNSGGPE